MSHRRAHRTRGFTLVELGIVIGIIAALGAAVLAGRGFIETARASKAIEVVDSVYKGAKVHAANNQGRFPVTADNTLLTTLHERGLSPVLEGDNVSIPGFTFERAAHSAGARTKFGIVIHCTNQPTSCVDIWRSKSSDNAMVGGGAGGIICDAPAPAAPPAGGTVNLCFDVF